MNRFPGINNSRRGLGASGHKAESGGSDGAGNLKPDEGKSRFPPVVRFFGPSGHDRLLVVNLGTDLSLVPNPEPLLAPPARGSWRELWSSEDPRYGGSGTPESDVRGPWTLAAHSALFLGSP